MFNLGNLFNKHSDKKQSEKGSNSFTTGGSSEDFMSLLSKFQNDESFKAMLQSPVFQEMIKDAEIQEALKSKNYLKLMSNRKFQQFLSDPQVREIIQKMKSSK